MKVENKRFLNVHDVAAFLEVSDSMGYKIIQQLNKELKNKGYIVIAGKVSRKYFLERVYAGEEEESGK